MHLDHRVNSIAGWLVEANRRPTLPRYIIGGSWGRVEHCRGGTAKGGVEPPHSKLQRTALGPRHGATGLRQPLRREILTCGDEVHVLLRPAFRRGPKDPFFLPASILPLRAPLPLLVILSPRSLERRICIRLSARRPRQLRIPAFVFSLPNALSRHHSERLRLGDNPCGSAADL
jgi:hypothetical protein